MDGTYFEVFILDECDLGLNLIGDILCGAHHSDALAKIDLVTRLVTRLANFARRFFVV